MKRLITIIVVTVLCLKLFGAVVVKLASAPSSRISDALHFDEGNVFDFLRLGDTPQHPIAESVPKRKPLAPAPIIKFVAPKPTVATAKPFIPKKISQAEVKKILAANEMKALKDKKDEEDKKEKERRKKRRKALEQLADKIPQTNPSNYFARNANVTPDQASSPQVVVGGFQSPPIAVVPPTDTTVKKKSAPAVAAQAKAPNIDSLTDQLVNHPTAALVKSFIGLYRSNQITAAQFFHVLGLMEKSRVSDSRRYAVVTAAQFQRIESFELLSDESIAETDTSIQALTTQALQAYQNLSQLPVLTAALAQGTAIETKVRASEVIDHIINGFTVNKNPPSNAEALLSPFIPLLEPLTHNQNPTLVASATTALQDIQKLPTILGSL